MLSGLYLHALVQRVVVVYRAVVRGRDGIFRDVGLAGREIGALFAELSLSGVLVGFHIGDIVEFDLFLFGVDGQLLDLYEV